MGAVPPAIQRPLQQAVFVTVHVVGAFVGSVVAMWGSGVATTEATE
ncbi:MAG: hypothetical protein ABDI19_10265 [Armatimonadota bacterium]